MSLQAIKPKVLSVKIIPNVYPDLAKELDFKPHHRSIGMLTCDIDDAGYTAIDEATKKADVEVVYAKSFYAGAAHSSGPLSGEFIGILAGPNPAEVQSGLNAAIQCLEEEAWFYAADPEGQIAFFPHVISRTGSYLSKVCGIPEGTPIAYLIAPPIEAMYALDLALKAAEVKLCVFYGPPTETNFAGGLLAGTQSACRAAARAFQEGVLYVARNPLKY